MPKSRDAAYLISSGAFEGITGQYNGFRPEPHGSAFPDTSIDAHDWAPILQPNTIGYWNPSSDPDTQQHSNPIHLNQIRTGGKGITTAIATGEHSGHAKPLETLARTARKRSFESMVGPHVAPTAGFTQAAYEFLPEHAPATPTASELTIDSTVPSDMSRPNSSLFVAHSRNATLPSGMTIQPTMPLVNTSLPTTAAFGEGVSSSSPTCQGLLSVPANVDGLSHIRSTDNSRFLSVNVPDEAGINGFPFSSPRFPMFLDCSQQGRAGHVAEEVNSLAGPSDSTSSAASMHFPGWLSMAEIDVSRNNVKNVTKKARKIAPKQPPYDIEDEAVFASKSEGSNKDLMTNVAVGVSDSTFPGVASEPVANSVLGETPATQHGIKRAINKAPYVRPVHPKKLCPHCNEHPEGFRGDHELRRHLERAHSAVRKMWICVDASEDQTFLANCKSCRSGKRYGIYYNAAAHLRRAHFNRRKRGYGRGKSNEKRGGIGGGDQPSMEVLKNWMREVEEISTVNLRDESEEAEEGSDEESTELEVTNAGPSSQLAEHANSEPSIHGNGFNREPVMAELALPYTHNIHAAAHIGYHDSNGQTQLQASYEHQLSANGMFQLPPNMYMENQFSIYHHNTDPANDHNDSALTNEGDAAAAGIPDYHNYFEQVEQARINGQVTDEADSLLFNLE